MTTRLTARAAIDHAAAHGLTLSKFADPTEGAREGLTVAEAREVAAQDPSLIYCDVDVQSADQRLLDDIAEALPEHDLRDLDGVDESSSTSAKLRAIAALVGWDMLREAAARVSMDAARLVDAAQDD